MLRLNVRRGPEPPSVLAAAALPQTCAQATLIAHAGRFHPARTLRSHERPMRSKAFSWSASVTAGQPR
eukprot:1713263-Lingulodinium_polyedra.AAC.1